MYISLAKCSNLIPLIPNIIRKARLAQVIQWFCYAVQCSCCCQAAVVQIKRSVGSDHVKQQLHSAAILSLNMMCCSSGIEECGIIEEEDKSYRQGL